ncbi:Crp/Fnr family transcriptional regulator [Nostoc sp. XA013]|nr:Crp/Fnr family transcriptional regulator [Nostoc sp. XA013]
MDNQPLEFKKNRLLAALPADEYERFVLHLEEVPLTCKQVLYQTGKSIEYIYFPQGGIVFLISSINNNGRMVEVGIVGNDGIVGMPIVLGDNIAATTAIVYISGSAMRMKASQLKTEFFHKESLQNLLARYMQAQHALVSLEAACNSLHTIEQRLARWLLLVCDRLNSDNLPFTHQLIAQMLGVRRSSVTEKINTLIVAGTICNPRGSISILNRQKLEAASCKCYQSIKNEYTRLLPM